MNAVPGSMHTGPHDADLQARLVHATAKLGLGLTEPALDRMMRYLTLLQRWNRVYNLTAVRDPMSMIDRHLVDCLTALPSVRRFASQRPTTPCILDVGSGGGLPGVVWAIAEPDWRVTCIDASAKKASFIRQAGVELSLRNLEAVHGRVEAMQGDQVYDLICSRAFASLADFTKLSRSSIASGGIWLAMKGLAPTADEVRALPDDIEMFHVEPMTVPGLDAQRCLVWMRQR